MVQYTRSEVPPELRNSKFLMAETKKEALSITIKTSLKFIAHKAFAGGPVEGGIFSRVQVHGDGCFLPIWLNNCRTKFWAWNRIFSKNALFLACINWHDVLSTADSALKKDTCSVSTLTCITENMDGQFGIFMQKSSHTHLGITEEHSVSATSSSAFQIFQLCLRGSSASQDNPNFSIPGKHLGSRVTVKIYRIKDSIDD
ncbi:hypothetical protein AVEN_163936-1 [Araneus ventricosus]|uniref:Uncharacterized protein n=1 Tax=Araneus ventricosus TaxID=182803 RepID=A0A4Y2WKE3_ARAVE|nr:hypothetical protein AVEN_163936-1 [Araneus ventricosus]